jgi:hypothetical protein
VAWAPSCPVSVRITAASESRNSESRNSEFRNSEFRNSAGKARRAGEMPAPADYLL